MNTPVNSAQRAEWQRQAARLLVDLLETAGRDGLPPLSWIVGSAGTLLVGRCPGMDVDGRAEFAAWTAHLAAVASPEVAAPGGRTFLHAVARLYDGLVNVAVVADVWGEDALDGLLRGDR